MKEIQLTQGKIALIDDEDYERVSQYLWYYKDTYAASNINTGNRKGRKTMRLHQLVLNFPLYKIDHKNRNKLDCRKENLRSASYSENNANREKQKGSYHSNWKGVTWHKSSSKWTAQVGFKGKNLYIGLFNFEYDAAQAYNFKAFELFGEFANLNTPEGICP